VNPIARARESWTYVPTEKAEQPQDYQNYDNGPQHEISPFEGSLKDLFGVTGSLDRAAVVLATQQDEDASRNGEDPHDHFQARKTQAEQCDQPVQDEPDAQQ
jgi:hypothetical protein